MQEIKCSSVQLSSIFIPSFAAKTIEAPSFAPLLIEKPTKAIDLHQSLVSLQANRARMGKLFMHNYADDTAMLTSKADVTMFKYQDLNIRFKTSPYLERYTSVKEWNNGYIVVMAKYKGVGEVEEYIDLLPILNNLYIDKDNFLRNIKKVEVSYD